MKTITEYRPLIFSELDAQAGCRRARQRRIWSDFALVGGYSAFGLWLIWDTGFAPWNWQFWLCFAPLYLAGELALGARLRRDSPVED